MNKEVKREKTSEVSLIKRDIHQAYEALDWTTLLDLMMEKASSLKGQERIQNLKPFSEAKEAESHSLNVEKASKLLNIYREEHGREFERPRMTSLDSYFSWKEKLDRRVTLSTHEFSHVRTFLMDCLSLKKFLNFAKKLNFSDEMDFLQLRSQIIKVSQPLQAIHELITDEGDIRVNASPLLFSLYKEQKEKTCKIQAALDQFVKDHSLKGLLQDRYVTTKEGRWVLPIKSGMRGHFDGLIHAMSQSHQTVFMEPLVVMKLNNQIRQIHLDMRKEINRLLLGLSQFFYDLLDELERSKNVLLEFDVLFAQALWALDFEAVSFRFESFFHLQGLKHPLLEREKNKSLESHQLEVSDVVPNDVVFSKDKRILLLSGPNAGGKTVFLKAIGLAAQMARFGLPICAEKGSVLPFFEDLHILIGDLQSVEAHRSQFSSHVKALHQFTSLKGLRHLLLIDEICASTDSEEGVALAKSFIQHYISQNVYAVITSHLRPLSFGWPKVVQVGSFEYSSTEGPTYKFLSGTVGRSHALDLAQSIGVPLSIIDRAKDFLGPKEKAYLDQIKAAQEAQKELQDLRETWQREIEKVKNKKKAYEVLLEDFKKEREKKLSRILRKTESKIEDLLQKVEKKEVFFRKSWLNKLKNSLPEIVKVSRTHNSPAPSSLEEFPRFFSPGQVVFVPKLNRKVVLQDAPNNRGEVIVLSQSMRLTLNWREVKPLPSSESQSLTPLSKYFPLGDSISTSEKPSFVFSSSKLSFSDPKEKTKSSPEKKERGFSSQKGKKKSSKTKF